MTKMIPPRDPVPLPTGNDRLVFEVLRAADGPVSAYDIMDRLKPDRPRIAPTTVYRALEHLIRAGRVRRIESLNAYLPASQTSDRAVVFTLWLSMTPAVGWALRPSANRTASTSLRFISSSKPSSRHV